MANSITCFEEWHEHSDQRQWELYRWRVGEIERLRAQLAAAEAEIELLRAENKLLRAELATVKVNYETYVNDVRTAEQAEIASLRAQLAAVHGLLREASDGRVLDWVDWIERAKKEVGDG